MGINHWGYIHFDKNYGWLLTATEEGEKSGIGLKITLKTLNELYNS